MYAIVTTPGLVIDGRPRGEAGKIISFFTREFGLIQAVAPGIRLEKSKLRYHSQLYTFGQFSFVRGREFWRLVNAEKSEDLSGKNLLPEVASILKRFLHGEESYPELFDLVLSFSKFVKELKPDAIKTAESIIIYRILYMLGYVGVNPELSRVRSEAFSAELVAAFGNKVKLLNSEINKAIRESHL